MTSINPLKEFWIQTQTLNPKPKLKLTEYLLWTLIIQQWPKH